MAEREARIARFSEDGQLNVQGSGFRIHGCGLRRKKLGREGSEDCPF